MDDAIEKVAPPRDNEAGVRASDTASIAVERDSTVEPFSPLRCDAPGYYEESRYEESLYGVDA